MTMNVCVWRDGRVKTVEPREMSVTQTPVSTERVQWVLSVAYSTAGWVVNKVRGNAKEFMKHHPAVL